MKATGMVRKTDELGRVVIPMELRRTLEISEREPLEIFCGQAEVHRKIGEKSVCLGCIREIQEGLR